MEETGLQNLDTKQILLLKRTMNILKNGYNQQVIKETWWYAMSA
jgi:hypothetical protein